MSATVEIDWSAVRTLAVAVGVREAARRLGISEDATLQRCHREGWLRDPEMRAVTARSVALRSSALSSAVISPEQVMRDELASLGKNSRLSMARGLSKAAAHVETMDGQEIVMDASNIKQTVQSLDLIHGWKEQPVAVKVALSVTGMQASVAADVADIPAIEGEWSDSPEIPDGESGEGEQDAGADRVAL